MTRRTRLGSAAMLVLSALAMVVVAPRVHASTLYDPTPSAFSPRVPLSAFSSPLSWFDPSRLHLSSTLSMGSGFGGAGSTSSALSVTSLSYAFKAPVTMSVSLGNTFGSSGFQSGGSQFFLEGFDLAWHPNKNAMLRVEMHNVRSPLQYGYGPWGGANSPYGQSSLFPY